MFAFALSFMVGGSLIWIDTSIDDGDRQEDEDPYFIDVPKGENDEGKSQLSSLPSYFKSLKCLNHDFQIITLEYKLGYRDMIIVELR